MSLTAKSRIVIAGAGSVGCYLGAQLAAAGRNVTLLLREPLAQAITRHGLRVSDLDGSSTPVPAGAFTLTADPQRALAGAGVVLVTVKSRHTKEMGELIGKYAPAHSIVVSLQNGVDNAKVLTESLGDRHPVVSGMIPFNVVQTRTEGQAPHVHRASSGTILTGRGVPGLRELLDVPSATLAEHDDIDAVLWGKLLINLNNALNALSGQPLAAELADRRWRLLLRGQMREAFPVLKAAGIRAAPIEGVHPRLVAFALRLRDPLFKLVAGRMLAVNPAARSSMWEDLEARRPTEIDYIQGTIVRLAEKHGLSVPLNRRVMQRIKEAEQDGKGSPRLTPAAV